MIVDMVVEPAPSLLSKKQGGGCRGDFRPPTLKLNCKKGTKTKEEI